MSYQNIVVETRGKVGIIRLNRPQALNALNAALIGELTQAVQAFEADAGIRVERLHGLAQFLYQRGIERIERLRPVEPDDSDLAAGLDDDVLIGHGLLRHSHAIWRSGPVYF